MKKIAFILCLILTYSCNSQTNPKGHLSDSTLTLKKKLDLQLPIETIDSISKIDDLRHSRLQSILEKEINKNAVWKGLVAKKLMAIGIVDMTDLSNIKYAGINDNNMMYAASLPKIAVLLAAMDAIDKGELEDSKEVRKDMRLMISKSNNKATTRMIDRVGYAKIEEVMRAPKHELYDEETGGGLWVGKRYGGGGDTNREPLKNLSHAATTKQVCSFYYQLAMGNLISNERSEEMLEIMKDPALHHKFVNTLDKIAPNAKVYRKSGSWKNYHSDSALVWGPKRRYIIVALIDNDFGESIIRNLVAPLEKVMKKERASVKQQKI
ncbi:serine hydrolase [Winogradskyella luteola]|uniref:beta-lactamase n=1 Tax=Winogradskyella luteola TaxID=2828330 RepID=A0A9X1F573_9FLAO|nr:serine hydrolase [Winogradskyella luteola]MBV7267616.1 serine hydrolase [Winogradskyella luteola]